MANLNAHAEAVRPLITELHRQGLSQRAIARELNRRHLPTARGKQWEAAQVGSAINWQRIRYAFPCKDKWHGRATLAENCLQRNFVIDQGCNECDPQQSKGVAI